MSMRLKINKSGRKPGYIQPLELRQQIRRNSKLSYAIRRGMREFAAMEAEGKI